MSYWIGLEVGTGGAEPVEVGSDRNYTSNVSPMWREALGRPLYEFHGAPASEAAGLLSTGVDRMEAEPEKFRAMNPPNGWGDYEGALDILRWLRDGCVQHPKATIRVGH